MQNCYYYISTGAKNAMFTLRRVVQSAGEGFFYESDNYICNLSTDIENANYKASLYAAEMNLRGVAGVFLQDFDISVYKRKGKLSVKDTQSLEMIEAGLFPFGKHYGSSIESAPVGYIMYWAEMNVSNDSVVTSALKSACLAVAFDKGYIALKEQAIKDRETKNALSKLIGAVGDKIEFSAVIETVITSEVSYSYYSTTTNYFHVMRTDEGNVVVYSGSKCLGEKGETVKVKATVKEHSEYKGTKTTKILRPKLV